MSVQPAVPQTAKELALTTSQDSIDLYFEADRHDDVPALDRLFTPDAVVVDQEATYEGTAAIRQWRTDTTSEFTYTTTLLSRVSRSDTESVVTARLDGDFPGATVDLEFTFEELDGLINRLTIS
jgi:hypothetical protein